MAKRFLVALVFALIPTSSGCSSYLGCRPEDNEQLADMASSGECELYNIWGTSMESLDGLDESQRPARVRMSRNDALVDISAASGMVDLSVGSNAPLAPVTLDIVEQLNITETAVDGLSVQFTDNPKGFYVSGGTLGTIHADCVVACEIDARLFVDTWDTVSFGDGVSPRLQLGVAVQSAELLQQIAAPVSVTFFDPAQPVDVMRAYRAFLDARGFSGEFTHCADGSECVDVPAAP